MRIIDISREIYDGMPAFIGYPKAFFVNWLPHETGAAIASHVYKYDFTFSAKALFMTDHHGTHVDAPYHFNPQGKTIDEMPVETFITEAIVLDLTHKKAGSFITKSDLEVALMNSGETFNPGDGVLLFTNWDKKWEDFEEYANHPGISLDAANWLIDKKVGIIGIDFLSLDCLKSPTRPGHTLLLAKHGITHIENLCNLDKIEEKRVTLIALPPKIRGFTGSPVRAVAIEGLRIHSR